MKMIYKKDDLLMKKKRIIALMLTLIMCLSLMPTNYVEAKAKTKLNKTSITLTVGKSTNIKLKNYAKLSKKTIKKVKWSSSNKKVATVKYSGKYRQNAKVTAKSTGNTSIKVKFNGKTYSCKVAVKDTTNKTVVTEEPTNTPTTAELTTEKPSTTETPTNTPSTTESNSSTEDDKSNIHIHNYEYIVETDPTCTKNGTKKGTCSCGDVVISEVPALQHDFSDIFKIDKAATCTTDGIKSKHCTRCNAKTDETIIKATGHSYKSVRTKEPTCAEQGIITKTCTKCNNKITESIPELGHKYVNNKCTVCGDIYVDLSNATEYDVSRTKDNSVKMYAVPSNNNLYTLYIKTITPGGRLSGSNGISIFDTNITFNKVEKIVFLNTVLAPYNCNALFANNGGGEKYDSNITSIENLNYLDMSDTTSTENMFDNVKLKSIDLSEMNLSKVKYMRAMFIRCTNLKSVIFPKTELSSVENMNLMFYGDSNLTTVQFNSTTPSLEMTQLMFNENDSLEKVDLSMLDFTHTYNMRDMFCKCKNLTEVKVNSTFINYYEENAIYGVFIGCPKLPSNKYTLVD